jgi:hypothetical protein
VCTQNQNRKVEIPQTFGVQQGDNMAPVLFLFLVTAFADTLKIVWKQQEIPIVTVMTAANNNLIDGNICSHTRAMFASKKLTAYEILQCLYVDDGAFPFGTREDLINGMELIYQHFRRFGLEMHIGQGTSQSKTECVFFPPPQFFQHSQHQDAAATTIVEQPAPSTNCPTAFPVGCNVIVTSIHPKHANKGGTVLQHTKKYVMFAPDKHPSNIIHILPKSLSAYHPDGRCMINSSDDDKEQNLGQTEREHKMYDWLDETQIFPVADGFVRFTWIFPYLGSLIS